MDLLTYYNQIQDFWEDMNKGLRKPDEFCEFNRKLISQSIINKYNKYKYNPIKSDFNEED